MLNIFHTCIILSASGERKDNEMLALYDNIKKRRMELGMTQDDLAKLTGYTDRSSIAKIEAGKVDLTRSKIMLFAEVLRISPADLMGWQSDNDYYDDPAVQKIAQEIYDNPEYRILFDAARDSKPEDLHMAAEILKKFKETNPDG